MTIIVYLRSGVPKRRDTNLDGAEQCQTGTADSRVNIVMKCVDSI
jgi:hypothetical protein